MPVLYILILIICLIGLSFGLSRQLARLTSYTVLRTLLLPGVAIHESAHIMGCVVTGTQIASLSFWTKTGGEVVHVKPRWAIIAQPIISFAPFIFGLILLAYFGTVVTGPTTTSLVIKAVSLYLMLTIGATLVPSKQDLIVSAWSNLGIIILASLIFYFSPNAWFSIVHTLQPTVSTFLTVDILLAILFLILYLIRTLAKR